MPTRGCPRTRAQLAVESPPALGVTSDSEGKENNGEAERESEEGGAAGDPRLPHYSTPPHAQALLRRRAHLTSEEVAERTDGAPGDPGTHLDSDCPRQHLAERPSPRATPAAPGHWHRAQPARARSWSPSPPPPGADCANGTRRAVHAQPRLPAQWGRNPWPGLRPREPPRASPLTTSSTREQSPPSNKAGARPGGLRAHGSGQGSRAPSQPLGTNLRSSVQACKGHPASCKLINRQPS